jgi:hypothetical protein
MHDRRHRMGALTAILSAASLLVASPAGAQAPQETPREVKVGLLMANLSEVRGAEQAFNADVLLLATWHDPALVGGSDETRTLDLDAVWHPTLLIQNQRSVSAVLPQEVTVRPDGTVSYFQRYLGTFSAPMDLREFPMDSQEFYVWIVAPVRAGSPVTLVPDGSLPALRMDDLSISDWIIGEPRLTEAPFQLTPGAPMNPGIRLSVPGHRLLTYYFVQVVTPLVAIVLMAWSVFWIAPSVVATRIGVLVTTMLTLIAYRFALANHVPRLAYLTRLDWFMVGATVIVVLALFVMAGCAFLMQQGREETVKKVDRVGRVIYPVAFLAYSLFVFLR